jgi:hypothetical protein
MGEIVRGFINQGVISHDLVRFQGAAVILFLRIIKQCDFSSFKSKVLSLVENKFGIAF